MEIRYLRHFVAAVEEGSVGKAAKRERLTQPAITRSIRSLERAMNVQLFERRRSGMVLTPYGTRLLEYARLILNTRRQALEDIEAMRLGNRGSLAVGVGSYYPSKLIPIAIDSLLAKDDVSVSVIEESFEFLCSRLRHNEIDVLYSVLPPEKNYPDLVFEKLFHIRSHIWARKTHPLVRMKKVTHEDLRNAEWIVPDGQEMSRFSQEFFALLGMEPPIAKVRTNSVSMAISAMLKHDLVAVLPDLSVRLAGGINRLASVKIEDTLPRTHAGLAYLRHGVRTQVFQDFTATVRSLVEEELAYQQANPLPPLER